METKHYIKLDDGTFTTIIGYGILSNIEKRLKSYIGHTGCKTQDFSVLYIGPDDMIRDLERFQKLKWRHDSLSLSKWVFEWLDPEKKKSLDDLEKFFDDKIAKDKLPIRKVKRDHLPFTTGMDKPMYKIKDILEDPDLYLEP
jgi:hypothetical protein